MTAVNRRAFLAALTAVAPRSAKATDADFEPIDTHTHIHRTIPPLVAAMEKAGWKALSICDSRELGDEPSGLCGSRQGLWLVSAWVAPKTVAVPPWFELRNGT